MKALPELYTLLVLLFTGFISFAVIQSAYAYYTMPRKEMLRSLLLSLAAALYIISDALTSIFTYITPSVELSRFFFILREISPMLFLIVTPIIIKNLIEMPPVAKKINGIFLCTGIFAAVAILSFAVYSPSLILTGIDAGGIEKYIRLIYSAEEMGPLLVIRDVLFVFCLIYTIFMIFYSEIFSKKLYRDKKIVIGLAVAGYFLSVYFYSVFFTNSEGRGFIAGYPYFSFALTIFVIFAVGGTTDIFAYYLGRLEDCKKNSEKLEYHDSDLGIPNRICFIKDIKSELKQIREGSGRVFLIILDVDNFQNLNESYGKFVCDEILLKLSERMSNLFHRAGTLYRIGGDDFSFITRNIKTEDDVMRLAERMITSLRNPFDISGSSYLVTVSIGILQIPQDGDDPDLIMKNAYSVIHKAKTVKNTIEVFSSELHSQSLNKIHIVNILRDSINNDRFALQYQPIVDSEKNLVHMEALLRCTSSDPLIGGPAVFMPLIASAGLTKDVDNMVVRKAFHDMEMNIAKNLSIGINMSTDQLINLKYGEFLSSFAAQYGIEPGRIILEVTENKLMENLKSGRESLMALKKCGFKIALDDFGTGFSSLAYLAELPVDILKLDMVFIQSVPGNTNKESMAQHILHLAHSLDLKVIAEGIELQEQFDFFKGLGCDLYQGYLFSRPAPLNEIISKYFSK